MSMSEWAKREVELAIEKEGECDYGVGCYKSALKAFDSLMEDGHSGFSIGATAFILNRLIKGLPLTPIEDTDDIWRLAYEHNDKGFKAYQCTRMSSLFKYVYDTGTITYHDNDRYYCVNINSPHGSYSSGLVRRIIDEMVPITMPYYPSDPYKVYCGDFLTDPANGDFDTVGVFYAIYPSGEKVEINRYFKEEDHDWIEIDKDEYERRYENRVESK